MWLGATPALADSGGARTVKYSQQDIIPVHAKLRFSTLIVLPQNEDILDFATGDKEFWIINGAHNLCYVHPAQAGIRSDLPEAERGEKFAGHSLRAGLASTAEVDERYVQKQLGRATAEMTRRYQRRRDRFRVNLTKAAGL